VCLNDDKIKFCQRKDQRPVFVPGLDTSVIGGGEINETLIIKYKKRKGRRQQYPTAAHEATREELAATDNKLTSLLFC